MKTVDATKGAYSKPSFEVVEITMRGVLCESPLEPVNPGNEHGWGMDIPELPLF